jgi:hypothetical protein
VARKSKEAFARQREYDKKRSAEFRASGLCTCGREVLEGFLRCEACVEARRKSYYTTNIKQKRRDNRLRILEHYGGQCVCCGQDGVQFLAIDHVEGDGAEQKRRGQPRSGDHLYKWIIKNNFPPDFQILWPQL